MTDVQTYKLYSRVARLGSFSAAARECGLAQSQVSRMIAELEASLGTRLLARTTRAVTPTEAGTEFLSRIESILASIEDAENSIREAGELRGTLRVAMPSTLAIRVILPRLAAFTERHPKLQIEVMLDDKRQDMVREAVDVGIRVGPLSDLPGTARLIGTMQRVIAASPGYLERHGTPRHPTDILQHRIVGGPAGAHATSWQFEQHGKRESIDVQPHVSVNDTAGALAAAIAGLGIISTTSWACRMDVSNGALTPLLSDWQMVDLPVHAYFPLGRATRMAARSFVEFIETEFARDEFQQR
ncbi:LysR family transcriptional regulator [Herbaspirillum rhizosphaerae]|uniref:LysR family transcriptional regulator n=1 Tax=Herbaspirillum rhizosphaerae TaxID=346179 RepID=UPI00067CA0D4|nr:LysR family transcriptional regulator [Herbaspirillum rhizosphaerae]